MKVVLQKQIGTPSPPTASPWIHECGDRAAAHRRAEVAVGVAAAARAARHRDRGPNGAGKSTRVPAQRGGLLGVCSTPISDCRAAVALRLPSRRPSAPAG